MARLLRRLCPASLLLLVGFASSGCDESALREVPASSGEAGWATPPPGFDPRQAAVVVARIDDQIITVGDVARRIEAMSAKDRERYRDPALRRALAAAMIDEALLEAEARRRGIDSRPEVREQIDEGLREAMKAQAALPDPATIPEGVLHAFYEENRALWVVPERRLPSVMGFDDREQAEAVLGRHRDGADDDSWQRLVASRDAAGGLAGNLAQVGPPGDAQGSNDSVPEPLRAAVFSIAELGRLAAEPVEHGGRFYLVRYAGRTAAQTRPFEDVRAGVLSLYLKRAREQAEQRLLEGLGRRFGVQIDREALARVRAPDGFDAYVPYWQKR